MKEPKYPKEPRSPYKPEQPRKEMDEKKHLGSIPIDCYETYTLQEWNDLVASYAPGVDPKDIKFSFEHEKNWEYDDYTMTSSVDIWTVSMVPDPRYEMLNKKYLKDMAKYENDLEDYVIAHKQYKKDLAAYYVEAEKYQLERAKLQVKRLEKKLKVSK